MGTSESYSRDILLKASNIKLKNNLNATNLELKALGINKKGNAGWRKELLSKGFDSFTTDDLFDYVFARDFSKRKRDKEKVGSVYIKRAKGDKTPIIKTQRKKKVATAKKTHKEKYYEYLKSDQWRLMRDGLFYRRGKECERCGGKDDIIIHHKTYDNVFKEKEEDLEVLCNHCHKVEHGIIKG